MAKGTSKFSRLMLERYLCGEVTSQEKTVVEAAYRDDPEVRVTIDLLRESTTEILAAYPAETMAREIGMRAHVRDVENRINKKSVDSSVNQWKFFTPARILVTLLLVIVCTPWVILYVNKRSAGGETERIKGQHPYLTVYRKAETGFEKLHDRSMVAPGDRIQVGYVAAGKRYGLIFSVDGLGVVTLHYPTDDSLQPGATQLENDGEKLLASSFELDSAPKYERFFFVTSERPFNAEEVLAYCEEQLARNPAATSVSAIDTAGLSQSMPITLTKENSR